MNVAGLNNQLLSRPVKAAAQGKAAPAEDEESFASELEPQANGTAVESGQAPAVSPALGGPILAAPDLKEPATVALKPAAAMVLAKPEAILSEKDSNSLTRRVVWNDFLRKMNDLGISADDILRAFRSLSKDELAQPPEQSVDKVVMALGLDGQQALLAKQAFNELIQKTKSKSFAEELGASPKQLSLALLSQAETQRKMLQSSLENMNQNFFMKPKHLAAQAVQGQMAPNEGRDPQAMNEVRREAVAAAGVNPEATPENLENPLKAAPVALPSLSGIAVPTAAPAAPAAPPVTAMGVSPVASLAQATPSPELNALAAQMQAPTAADKKSVDELIRSFSARSQQPTAPQALVPVVAGQVAVPVVAGKSAASAAAVPVGALGAMTGILAAGQKETKGGAHDDSSNADPTMTMGTALVADNHGNAAVNTKGEFQAQMAKNGAPQTMAIPQVLQQAHIMVRDGGGDMKVTLHPEGLGQVAMRVSVDDGKVSVQMITESDEAKKLIERQIGELKSGLNANHLQVESIKVDTASSLGRQLEQQYQDAQRQQAQASMEQFRQDHQGWRRSFFETGTVNPYIGQNEGPRDVRAPSATARSLSQRRLDLVA